MPRSHLLLTVGLVVGQLLFGAASSAAAQEIDPVSDAARELAERHAPIVLVARQDAPCDSAGESFAPMSVDLILDNPDVLLRQAGVGDPVVERAPSAASLYGRGEGFFLDFPGLALEPGCVYEQDFLADADGQPSVVYAHVATQADAPGKLVIQYWLYWYYNDWNNKHESDWEFIQVLFEASSVDEALTEDPVSVGYAQHEGGERSDWNDGKLERDGTHPLVYSSRGSHASYFESAVFLGRRGTEGVGCDTTVRNTVELRPEVALLPDQATGPTNEFAWLGFTGRWGERGGGPFNGPTGPNTKPQWTQPIDWHDDLRESSVKLPGAEETNGTVLSTFCSVVDFGSNQLRAFQVSPGRLIAIGIAAALLARFLARRTEWSSTPPTPLRRRRRIGQMVRTSLASHVSSRGALLVVGACYLPATVLIAIVGRASSFTSMQAVAGLATTIMATLATSFISAFWHLDSVSSPHTLSNAFSLVRRRLGPVTKTTALSLIIVVGLAITVIGIPLAIRQAIRYQFAVPVATTEGLAGMNALRRSSALVHGRWWRTATAIVLLLALAFAVNSTLQLGLLFALSGVPLWAYGALSFLVTGLFVPMLTTAPVLLYGDACAQEAGDTSHEEPSVASAGNGSGDFAVAEQ